MKNITVTLPWQQWGAIVRLVIANAERKTSLIGADQVDLLREAKTVIEQALVDDINRLLTSTENPHQQEEVASCQ